jgi:hypothetical protein
MDKTIDSERLKTELPDMQRREDEAGQIIEGNGASPDPILIRPAPIHARRRVSSLRWNARFVIQPFLPGSGMILISEKHKVHPPADRVEIRKT